MGLGVQDGDKGGRAECANDVQGIDTTHQVRQLLVLADHGYSAPGVLTEVEARNADLDLGDMDSFSPLMTINPIGLVMSAELHNNTEVMGVENPLNISNWVKHRIPSFSKIMGLSLGRHEKMCIMLLQRLEREIEVANLQHRQDAAHRKAVSKDKGKRELRNLISSVNYDGR